MDAKDEDCTTKESLRRLLFRYQSSIFLHFSNLHIAVESIFFRRTYPNWTSVYKCFMIAYFILKWTTKLSLKVKNTLYHYFMINMLPGLRSRLWLLAHGTNNKKRCDSAPNERYELSNLLTYFEWPSVVLFSNWRLAWKVHDVVCKWFFNLQCWLTGQ